ncbi:hypothetical protein CgunFtcFv8_015925 [Champsocephalus gunnari]|uniref:Uncharacterized protein n=1 Tax=Champsocephalus gunnari TaxID=52237 RepID=A0AAN8C9V9_CHAGU|nr:hypothetical protein CgunFtcFv8_015925 [Champsocephalus gunnari]
MYRWSLSTPPLLTPPPPHASPPHLPLLTPPPPHTSPSSHLPLLTPPPPHASPSSHPPPHPPSSRLPLLTPPPLTSPSHTPLLTSPSSPPPSSPPPTPHPPLLTPDDGTHGGPENKAVLISRFPRKDCSHLRSPLTDPRISSFHSELSDLFTPRDYFSFPPSALLRQKHSIKAQIKERRWRGNGL